ncbi:hypothetical protein EA462_12795 [Natrarchaeobius halalkaliphilus]|uniref:DUF8163 domain-containing protein n=1 Tax=Natrarchaeobius halalkaliphilus TaxID=1679091 RepID=A0A3N6M7A4_9EURY|nr:hypothetical protein [Natrarchaeobius halalkaliphilus]RQG89236.1 hypothetical protein EA462_12795 [Natrarchaeobius halalkaliphilus]
MSLEPEPTGRENASVRSVPEVIALVIGIGGLWFAVGPVGGVIGGGTAVLWYAFGVPYALAAGFVGLTAVTAGGSTAELGTVRVPVLAYGLLVLAAGYRTPTPLRFGRTVSGTVAGLAGVGWLAVTFAPDSLWIAGVATLVFGITVSSVVHRYERFRLGLTATLEDHNGETDATDRDSNGFRTASDRESDRT